MSNRIRPIVRTLIVQEYQNGSSLLDLAERYGIAFSTVRNALIEANVPRRSPGFHKNSTGTTDKSSQTIS